MRLLFNAINLDSTSFQLSGDVLGRHYL